MLSWSRSHLASQIAFSTMDLISVHVSLTRCLNLSGDGGVDSSSGQLADRLHCSEKMVRSPRSRAGRWSAVRSAWSRARRGRVTSHSWAAEGQSEKRCEYVSLCCWGHSRQTGSFWKFPANQLADRRWRRRWVKRHMKERVGPESWTEDSMRQRAAHSEVEVWRRRVRRGGGGGTAVSAARAMAAGVVSCFASS